MLRQGTEVDCNSGPDVLAAASDDDGDDDNHDDNDDDDDVDYYDMSVWKDII